MLSRDLRESAAPEQPEAPEEPMLTALAATLLAAGLGVRRFLHRV